jgi:hemerythrin superfamily protein
MDALTVLRREHTRIEQLFAEFDELSQCACSGRAAIVREIDKLARRHFEMEEALIYDDVSKPQEHDLIVSLLDEIMRTDCHQPGYVPRVLVLRDILLQHVKEEEKQVFPNHAACTTAA